MPESESAKTPHFDEILRHDFSGKLVLYVIKTVDEADIPPSSINLYARDSREPFSLEWVRSRCNIDLPLYDADKIIFSSAADHAICVKNKGNVTIMRGMELLLKEKKYTLNYNDKLLLIFNNGAIEIEVHYKNIKPSEREG